MLIELIIAFIMSSVCYIANSLMHHSVCYISLKVEKKSFKRFYLLPFRSFLIEPDLSSPSPMRGRPGKDELRFYFSWDESMHPCNSRVAS